VADREVFDYPAWQKRKREMESFPSGRFPAAKHYKNYENSSGSIVKRNETEFQLNYDFNMIFFISSWVMVKSWNLPPIPLVDGQVGESYYQAWITRVTQLKLTHEKLIAKHQEDNGEENLNESAYMKCEFLLS